MPPCESLVSIFNAFLEKTCVLSSRPIVWAYVTVVSYRLNAKKSATSFWCWETEGDLLSEKIVFGKLPCFFKHLFMVKNLGQTLIHGQKFRSKTYSWLQLSFRLLGACLGIKFYREYFKVCNFTPSKNSFSIRLCIGAKSGVLSEFPVPGNQTEYTFLLQLVLSEKLGL